MTVPEDHVPLTEATFFVLLSLALNPKHGYAIMKNVQELSNNRIFLSTGTLYGALKRLLEQGWITRLNDESFDETGRQQKVYALTDIGQRMLTVEATRLQTLVQAATAQRVLGQV